MKNILILLLIIHSIVNAKEQIHLHSCKGKGFATAWDKPTSKEAEIFIEKCKEDLETTLSRINLLDARASFNKNDFLNAAKIISGSRTIIIRDFETSNKESDEFKTDRYFYVTMLSLNAYSHYQIKKYKEAAKDFELYLKQEKDLSYMKFLASSYSYLKQFKKSVAVLKEAYKLKPEDETALYLASVYSKSKEFKKSMNWLNRIINTENKNIIKWIESDDNFDNMQEYKLFIDYINKLKVAI